MNLKTGLLMELLAGSTVLGVALAVAMMPAYASNASGVQNLSTTSARSCSAGLGKVGVQDVGNTSDLETPMAGFTAAESDAAVLLFECDCPACINALRQIRNPSLVDAVQGHCWGALANNIRGDRQKIDDILEALEAAETQGPDTPLEWD